MAERCASCKFFQPLVSNGAVMIDQPIPGYCRRFPPTAVAAPDGSFPSCLVQIPGDAWCGEYKLALVVRA